MDLSVFEILDELFFVDNVFAAWLSLACVTLGGAVKLNAIGISLSMFSNKMLLTICGKALIMVNINDFEL